MRHILAPSADFEIEIRNRHYPEQIEKGKVTADQADADLADWADIAAWLASSEGDRLLDLPYLERVAARAVERLDRASAAKPYDRELEARLSAVTSIHGALQHHNALIADLNARIRARSATPERRAA